MAKLVICRGLQASGKSTFADELVAKGGWVKVEKDLIRETLRKTGWSWSQGAEHRDVLPVRDGQIRQALQQRINCISSDTNLDPAHVKALEGIAAEYGAEVEVKWFPISVEEAIERDSKRGEKSVGAKVIRDSARRWKPEGAFPIDAGVKYEKYARTGMLTPAILCDLDGTLALIEGRSPYDAAKCEQDRVNLPVMKTIRFFNNEGYEILYLSGREDKFRPETLRWLSKVQAPPGPLWMRKTGDFRKDWIVKNEIFDANVRGHYDVLMALDDRQQVVDHYRSIGLTVFQVAPGNF